MIEHLIKTHRDFDSLDFKDIWETGIFVFDSNVLLDLYRLPESASKDLIDVLNNEGINSRIWIGFQVVLEFLNNRYEAISDQKNKFNTVRGLLEDSISQYEDVFSTLSKELSKLKLKQRHSLIDPDKFIHQENIDSGIKFVEEFIEDLQGLEDKQSDVNDTDKIKDVVLELFKDKTGQGFTKKELDEIYKNGEKRYSEKIPPGYKDKSKTGSYIVENRELVRKFGDLILWKEIIEKAKSDNVKHIVLVTGDVKEDWWFEKRGKKLGPRKELLNEIYTEAPSLETFHLYDTSSFLRHAKSAFKLSISDSSISETKDLIERSRRNRIVHEEGLFYLDEMVKDLARKLGGFRVGVGKSVYSLPAIRANEVFFIQALMEIYTNAIHHGREKYVGVQAKTNEDSIILRFKNKTVESDLQSSMFDNNEADNSRGYGLDAVRDFMSREGIDVHIVERPKSFVVELYIPKDKFYSDLEQR